MGIIDIFRNIQHKKSEYKVATIVKQMFDEAGISPQCPDKNVFLTVIDGVHCSFRTILKCDDKQCSD